jgi:hypothetical protein
VTRPTSKVVRKGTTTNKLTIAKDRVEIKLREGVDDLGEKWLALFAGAVLAEVLKDGPVDKTLRGRFRRHSGKNCIQIDLSTGGAKNHVKSYHSESMEHFKALPPGNL